MCAKRLARFIFGSRASALLVWMLLSGCAHVNQVGDGLGSRGDSVAVPLTLQGQDTRLQINFPPGDQRVDPGSFKAHEICYLSAGEFRIDCFPDGSSLNLGPNDTTDLLTDNPMWTVQPLSDSKPIQQQMRIYGLLFLIGGTIERLPGTLADYIEDPGPHQRQAIVLAQALLARDRAHLQGQARGGGFRITLELTDSGTEKLVNAMEDAGEPASGLRMVKLRKMHHRTRHSPSQITPFSK